MSTMDFLRKLFSIKKWQMERSAHRRLAIGERLVKVVFPVPADHWQTAYGSETMWAADLGGGRYRLLNSPFVVYGFSYQDIVVAAESADGGLIVSSIANRGGYSTYRLFVAEGLEPSAPLFREYWEPLQRVGCTFERATARLLAVDIPPQTNIHTAYELLQRGEAAGAWDVEEAHCGHQVT